MRETTSVMPLRCAPRARLMLLVTVLALFALRAGSAEAFSQRGFVFSEAASFGSEGVGAGQLSSPAGMAVSQSTGDVYVDDPGNHRVDEFGPHGEFIQAWGLGVIDGEKKLEVCTNETHCIKGLGARNLPGVIKSGGEITVDNDPESPSFEDIYVEAVKDEEGSLIEKFNNRGELLDEIRGYTAPAPKATEEVFEEPHGIATGEHGELFVYNEEEVFEFNNATLNQGVRSFGLEFEQGEPHEGFAAAADGKLFASHTLESTEKAPPVIAKEQLVSDEETGEQEALPLSEALVLEPSLGVAVSPNDQDVLIDLGTAVVIQDAAGDEVQRFSVPGGTSKAKTVAGIAANNNTNEVLVANAATGRIEAFVPEPAGPPRIEEAGSSHASPTGADLEATIAPGGAATTYWARYSPEGSVPTAAQPCVSPCVEVPVPHAALAEGAEADFANVAAAPIVLSGLASSHKYGYRLFAENEHGKAESAQQTLKTQPAELGSALLDGRSWQLVSPPKGKNGAFIEAQSEQGGLIQAAANGNAITYIASTAFEGSNGNRAPEPSQILATRHEEGGASSWSNVNINTPNEEALGIESGQPPEYWFFSDDLSQALVFPRSITPLAPEANEATVYLRHNTACESATERCYTPLVDSANVTGEIEVAGEKRKAKFGGTMKHFYLSPDGTEAVIESGAKLTNEPTTSGVNLYMWKAGALKLINTLSNGTSIGAPRLGYENKIIRNAVSSGPSSKGERVVFEGGTPAHLYERNMKTGKTLQLDAPEAGVIASGSPEFQTADENGQRIFFTSVARLTKNSTAQSKKPDLYVCEVQEPPEAEPVCKLTDLSTDPNAGEAANVQGGVPGAAKDGSDVFFVANGALVKGAPKGNCTAKGEEESREAEVLLPFICNLYVRHRGNSGEWGAPKLIATLSIEDTPDWGEGPSNDLGEMTSRVSPNGEWFAFMSDRRLPTATQPAGYDNRDAVSGKPDEEVFLYNATKEKLLCASCDPSGARPIGVHDEQEVGEGFGLLVDRPQRWLHRWLAANVPGWTKLGITASYYQSRYLLDNGMLFFDSPQSLVPQDVNGSKEDVYEYEPAGTTGPVGVNCSTSSESYGESSLGCVSLISSGQSSHESAFLDASESGNDVFFDTAGQLVGEDLDQDFDVYDASVCGLPGTSACVPPPAARPPVCPATEECRSGGTELGGTGAGPSGSLAPSGDGNSSKVEVLSEKEEKKPPKPTPKPLTRAQKYAKALKVCKKIKHKHKHKREACVKLARKRYGPVKKNGKKAAHR